MLVEELLFYLIFAKTKLNKDCKEHQKAKEEITKLIERIQHNQDTIEEILQRGD